MSVIISMNEVETRGIVHNINRISQLTTTKVLVDIHLIDRKITLHLWNAK